MVRRSFAVAFLCAVAGSAAAGGCSKSAPSAPAAPAPAPSASAAPGAGAPVVAPGAGAAGAAPSAAPGVPGSLTASPAPSDTAGPTATGQGFRVEVKPPADAAVGREAIAEVVLTPTDGYKVNREFPTSLEVTPPAGVDVAKARQTPSDAARFDEKGALFAVRFTPQEAGEKKFVAVFKFAVCTATTCDPKREALAWTVNVK